jgi:hypothetical protein
LQVVAPNTALRLKATRDFVDGAKTKRAAGDGNVNNYLLD